MKEFWAAFIPWFWGSLILCHSFLLLLSGLFCWRQIENPQALQVRALLQEKIYGKS